MRDLIPNVIHESGKEAQYQILDEDLYQKKLNEKLIEECQEWVDSESIEELADILEVLKTIANAKGIAWYEIEEICAKKKEERGGFDQRILLIQTEEDQN